MGTTQHHARGLALFEGERSNLFSIAYRMLGERAAAEDIVQEAWIKWSQSNQDEVQSPKAWLRAVTTRLSIDALRSARSRRESYVGPWLPEALVEETTPSAEDIYARARDCELAMLWAMERLGEEERAAFILREVFDADYEELAATLGKSEAACRKLVSRAAKRVREAKPRFVAEKPAHVAAMANFAQACMAGDHKAALALLAPDVISVSDGGGKRRAAFRVLNGAPEVLQVFMAQAVKRRELLPPRILRVNGRTCFAILNGGEDDFLISLIFDDSGKISWIYQMRNPDKLPLLPAD